MRFALRFVPHLNPYPLICKSRKLQSCRSIWGERKWEWGILPQSWIFKGRTRCWYITKSQLPGKEFPVLGFSWLILWSKISPEYSLEGLMLKLKLQYFDHLMQRTDSLEKTLMLGKIEGRRKRGWQRMRWLDGITDSMEWVWANPGSWWWTGRPGVLQSWGRKELDTPECLNWTELMLLATSLHPLNLALLRSSVLLWLILSGWGELELRERCEHCWPWDSGKRMASFRFWVCLPFHDVPERQWDRTKRLWNSDPLHSLLTA